MRNTNRFRSYSELIKIPSYEGRYEYLKLGQSVGDMTFGGHRWLNQRLYRSKKWKEIRDRVILRDDGCDMACDGYDIHGRIIVHHMNPLTIDDIINATDSVFDMENLICVSFDTHNAITYGDATLLRRCPIIRRPNDTCPWKL